MYAVGLLMRRHLATDEEMDLWIMAVALATASGFSIDRALGSPSTLVRLGQNLLHRGGWAATMFLAYELLAVVFGERGLVAADWIGIALAVPVAACWWASMRVGTPDSREQDERLAEVRRQARQDIDDFVRGLEEREPPV